MHVETVGVGTTAGTTVTVDKLPDPHRAGRGHADGHRQDHRRLVPPGVGRRRARRHRLDHRPAADHPPRGPAAGRRRHRLRGPAAGGRGRPHRPAYGEAGLMSFAWPSALLALLAFPLLLGVAWWSRRRRRRAAVRVTSAALVRAALPGRSRWRRRIPAALLRARSRRARGRGRPPAGDRRRPVQLDDDPAGPRRLRVDVLDGRAAEPADRRGEGGGRVHHGAAGRRPDRPGRLRRDRRRPRPAHRRHRRAAGRAAEPDAPPAAPRSARRSSPRSTRSRTSTRRCRRPGWT